MVCLTCSLTQDYANPHVRPYIEIYPIRTTKISESMHSRRLVYELDPELHTPMWARGHTHWFIGELAMLTDGRLVVPQAWYRRESQGEVLGEGYLVMPSDPKVRTSLGLGDYGLTTVPILHWQFHQLTSLNVQLGDLVEFKTAELRFNIHDLERSGLSGRLAGM